MTTTTTERRETDLATMKAYAGISITLPHRRLVAKFLAEKAYCFGEDSLTGHDWQVLREHVAPAASPNPELRFTDLVAAFGEDAECAEDAAGWGHRHDMSAVDARTCTANRLFEAVESLVSVRHG